MFVNLVSSCALVSAVVLCTLNPRTSLIMPYTSATILSSNSLVSPTSHNVGGGFCQIQIPRHLYLDAWEDVWEPLSTKLYSWWSINNPDFRQTQFVCQYNYVHKSIIHKLEICHLYR
jgi:hypothetical protein